MCRALPLFLLVAAIVACAGNRTDPVTGKSYYSPLGNDYKSQDAFIRSQFLQEIMTASDGGVLPEPAIVAACATIFEEVAAALPAEHRRDFSYRLIVSPSPTINAYTYGGGRVHCHLGLIAFCEDASELAGVLAHEIGHISHDHVGQSMGRRSRLAAITSVGRIAGRPGRRLTEAVGGILGGAVLVRYTRKQESEADLRAVEYTRAAGIDPDGVARFFERLARDTRSNGPALFATHPPPRNRVRAIRRRIEESGGAGTARRTDASFEAARRRALEVLPHYVRLHEALAGEEVDPVVRAADAGIAALPHHAQFHFWKGVAHEAKRERGPALAELGRAVALDDTNVVIPYIHSVVAFDALDYAAAERSASAVIRMIPVIPATYLVRGVSRLKLGRKPEAFADFDRLIELVDPGQRKDLRDKIREVAPDYRGDAG